MDVSFSLFAVKEKRSDRSPDYTGSVEVAGQKKHDIAVWESRTKDGRKYYSGKIRPARERDEYNQDAPARDPIHDRKPSAPLPDDDDLPFH